MDGHYRSYSSSSSYHGGSSASNRSISSSSRRNNNTDNSSNSNSNSSRKRQKLLGSIRNEYVQLPTWTADVKGSSSMQQGSMDDMMPRANTSLTPIGYNPLYNNAAFRAYRAKQAEKAASNGHEEQKWPEWLEQAFCDALLTIPAMGRCKYQMAKRPHDGTNGGSKDQMGRNMMISEWLWLAYLNTLPPGTEPPMRRWREHAFDEKTGSARTVTTYHPMFRDRKMVSSHIQVTKNFFKEHPLQHLIFVADEERKGNKASDEEPDHDSFKNNTVLRALREQRLPQERYNYAYWSHLLAADQRVQIRPKVCWIKASDDAGVLHEYMRGLSQVPSTSLRTLKAGWERNFPALSGLINSLSQFPGDILHLHTTLDLNDAATQLSAMASRLTVTVDQPGLVHHNWRIITRLCRPRELSRGAEDAALYVEASSVGHDAACQGLDDGECACVQTRQTNELHLPCPNAELAIALGHLATFPPCTDMPVEAAPRGGKRGRAGRLGSEHDRDPIAAAGPATQTRLVQRLALTYELWSQAPGRQPRQPWTRRSLLVWTFGTAPSASDAYAQTTSRRSPAVARQPSGQTAWRFVSATDPADPGHVRQSLLGGPAAAAQIAATAARSSAASPPAAPLLYTATATVPDPAVRLGLGPQWAPPSAPTLRAVAGDLRCYGLATPPPAADVPLARPEAPGLAYPAPDPCWDESLLSAAPFGGGGSAVVGGGAGGVYDVGWDAVQGLAFGGWPAVAAWPGQHDNHS